MSKFYTPDISEFYVGFECEFFNITTTKTWLPIICDVDYISIAYDTFEHGSNFDDDSIEQTFRVKYLNKREIETTLNRKQLKGDNIDLNFQLIINDNLFYEFDYNINNKILEIEKWTTYNNEENNNRVHTIFRGEIKNKSELIILLNKLNIK